MQYRKLLLFLMTATLAAAQPAANSAERLEGNKKLLLEFFRLGADREARMKMLAEDYVQHNPRFLEMDKITGKHGREAWGAAQPAAAGHARLTDTDFNLRSVPVILMAEDDAVIGIFKANLPDPDDSSRSYEAFNFEAVRIKDGLLTEHWDAVKLAPGWRTELETSSPPTAIRPAQPPVTLDMTVPRSTATADRKKLDTNKRVVREYLRLKPDNPVRAKLLVKDFVEHNPRRIPDPDFVNAAVVLNTAEGDYVCLVLKADLPDPDQPAANYQAFTFSAFRISGGKIAEHWDGVKLAKDWRSGVSSNAR
jgi:predicted SnoaL-like aldol condensation-catalyzing enzyme